jgi:1,4-dihydroxy-2-naphthoate octaprenyltransferase
LGPAVAALVGAVLLQIGANLANDVFDFEKGADTETRLGPVRAVQAGLLTPGEVRRGMIVVFLAAIGVGLYLTWVAGWPILAIGLVSIASALAYTGGPYPLAYHGFGDVFVLSFFGFVAVCGTAFVQLGTVPELSLWAAVPVGALATAILVVNNVRDRETDVHAGKRTLAVRFGNTAGLVEYGALLSAAYAVPVALVLTGRLGWPGLLPLVTLPLGLRLFLQVRLWKGPALNSTLAKTALLLLLFGGLFAVGIGAGRL